MRLLTALLAGLLLFMPAFAWGDSWGKSPALEAQTTSDVLDKETAEEWFNKGIELYSNGKYEDAIQAFDEAIKINPQIAAVAWSNKGNALASLGKYDDAIKAYDQAININPENTKAWSNKGATLNLLGKYGEAIEALDQAISIDPQYAKAWFNKGNALDSQGKYDEAIKAYDQAIDINPQDSDDCWIGKAVALSALNRTAEADLAFAKFRELTVGKKNADKAIDATEGYQDQERNKFIDMLEGDSRAEAISAAAKARGNVIPEKIMSGSKTETRRDCYSSVYSLAFSPDGKTLASGSDSSSDGIKLWYVSNGSLIRRMEGYSARNVARSVAFSPDGKTLASGSGDLKRWNVSDGSLIGWPDNYTYLWMHAKDKELSLKFLQMAVSGGHSDYVNSVDFSPDGKMLASGSDDKTIKLWDIINGSVTRIRTLGCNISLAYGVIADTNQNNWSRAQPDRNSLSVRSVVFSPDGKMLASGSEDKAVRVWNVSNGSLIRTLQGHSSTVSSMVFSPDGKMLASGSYDKTVRLWNVSSGSLIRTLEGHSGPICSVAFSPDGRMLASGSADKAVKLWNISSGTVIRTLEGHSSTVSSVVFSPNGKMLASGSYDGTIELWDLSKGSVVRTIESCMQ